MFGQGNATVKKDSVEKGMSKSDVPIFYTRAITIPKKGEMNEKANSYYASMCYLTTCNHHQFYGE